ncbi:MAG: MFS transporter [Ignavibacteriae bacterium]|nr:MFS transporter [Ignavibacteriota bacterium]
MQNSGTSIKPSSRLILSLCLIHFLLGLDINIVSVTLPSIAANFQVSPGIVTRVVWVYFLILTCLLFAFGRIGDINGFRKIYSTGIAVFITGSLMSAVSFSFDFLILSRGIQAIGAAVLFSLTPAIIAFHFPGGSRGKIFGLNYSFTALGGIIGRAASGFLIANLGWNSIFYLNIPFGITALYFVYKYLPDNISTGKTGKFDIPGTVLIFGGLFLLMMVLNTGGEYGWYSSQIIITGIAGLLLTGLFFYRQIKIEFPLFDLKVLKEKNISLSTGAFVFIYMITNGMIYLMPFYLLWIKLLTKQETGLMMAVPSVMQLLTGYASGKLSDKISIKKICSAGIIIIIISLILHLFLSGGSPSAYIFLAMALYGGAIGFFIPANTNNIMSYAPAESKGSVSSFMTTSIRLGSALGVVIFGMVLTAFVPSKDTLPAGIPTDIIMAGFRGAFITAIVLAVAALAVISFTENKKKGG